MDLFLNPNFTYLILVIGFLIAILALVSPGTGVLEAVAIGLIIFAGWLISRLEFNWVALAVLLLGVFPFLWAVRKTQKWYFLVISLVALTLGSTFLFVDDNWRPIVNPALAIVVNLLVVGFFWVIVRKVLEALQHTPAHIFADLVGSIGETRTEVFHEGSVYAGGEMWTATSKSAIPAHTKVRILERRGFTLEVEEVNPDQIK
jgi:membrane-bound serine protease (ClpP class)